jgi:hypothetical protein
MDLLRSTSLTVVLDCRFGERAASKMRSSRMAHVGVYASGSQKMRVWRWVVLTITTRSRRNAGQMADSQSADAKRQWLSLARSWLALMRTPMRSPTNPLLGDGARGKLDTTQATLTGTFPAHAALSDWKWGGWTDRVSRRSCARYSAIN